MSVFLKLSVYVICSYCVFSKSGFDYVNPYIGTGGNGYGTGGLPLGAQVPFGSVRLGPDTCQYDQEWSPWEHTGGYYYNDNYIRMLSHTHLVGAGVVDYGGIGVLPIINIPTHIGTTDFNRFPWIHLFSHNDEITEPGYYSIYLQEAQIQIELTATLDVGLHRYTFNNSNISNKQYILFDTSYTLQYDACQNSSFTIDFNNNEIIGFLHEMGSLSSRFGGVYIYYIAQFSTTFNTKKFGTWKNGKIKQYNDWNDSNTFSMNGKDIGFWLEFDKNNGNTIEMYIAISFISLQQARNNLYHDLHLNISSNNISSIFDIIKNETQETWRDMLDLVKINNIDTSYITNDNLTVFYTSIYHTFLAPTKFSESGGKYLGFDLNIHELDGGNNDLHGYYTDISGWDVYRTEFPWLSLIQPLIMGDIIQSLIFMYQQGGDLPRWPLGNGYTQCMFGTHANIMIADAVSHNLSYLFDLNIAYKGMYQSATTTQKHAGRNDINDYINLGYVPYENSKHGACYTLAYCYDDWAISKVAKYLNKMDDYNMFLNRSKNYKNVWSSDKQFMCPRYKDNDTFLCPFDPLSFDNDIYIEGNAWHYRFNVQHDVSGLIQLFKNNDYYIKQLQLFFDRGFDDKYNILPNPYYWAGNEEDLFAVWQFVYQPINRQDLTAYYSRKLLQTYYFNKPNGIPGNDDYGTMSAWSIFAFLGFYPRSGDGSYIIGSPYFNDITLYRDNGNINIKVYNAPNIYISNCTINGEILKTPFIQIQQIMNGALIEFYMTHDSNQSFNFMF